MTCGIYKITNTVNGWVYIGSSLKIETRWVIHRGHLKDNKHHNKQLQEDINKCGGVDVLSFMIIEEVEPEQGRIYQRENYWIEWAHEHTPGCYNERRPTQDLPDKLQNGDVEYIQWQRDINNPDYVSMMRDILQTKPASDAAIAAGCSESVLRRFRNIDSNLPFSTWRVLKRTLGTFVKKWQESKEVSIVDTSQPRRIPVSATLPYSVTSWLRSQPVSTSTLMEAAVINFYGLETDNEKRQTVCVSLPPWLVRWLKARNEATKESTSAAVERALVEHYRPKPEEGEATE